MVFIWVKINRWKSIRRKLLSPDKFVPLENISQNCHQGLFHHSHISQVSGRYPHPDSHRLSRRSRTYWLALLLKRQTFRKYAIAIGDKYQCVKESNAKAKLWWLWCWESSRCWERQRVEVENLWSMEQTCKAGNHCHKFALNTFSYTADLVIKIVWRFPSQRHYFAVNSNKRRTDMWVCSVAKY